MNPDVEDWVAEFAATAERSPDAMCLRGIDGAVLYLNAAGLDLLGAVSVGEIDMHADFVFGPVGEDGESVSSAVGSGGVWTGDTVLMHSLTGESIPVWVSAYVVTGRHARTPVVAVVARDLRGRFDRERRLRELAEDAAAHAREQRAVADLCRIALTANLSQVLMEATGAARSLAGITCAVVFEPVLPDRSELRAITYCGPGAPPEPIPMSRSSHAAEALRSGGAVICSDRDSETRFPTDFMTARGVRSGAAVVIEGPAEPWGVLAVYCGDRRTFEDGEVAFLQTVARVVSAAMRRNDLETELRRRTLHDPLTGLPNRVLVRQRIEDVRVHGNPCPIAVLVIDLDNFKMINDTLGHVFGDRTLETVADLLGNAAGTHDTVSRFGGDEFVVLHRGGDPVALARRMLSDLSVPFEIDGYDVTVSASIGVAVDDRYEADADDLFRRADAAMYSAKKSRTSGFAVFGEPEGREPRTGSALRGHVENDLEFEK